jgi:hypothetical protein
VISDLQQRISAALRKGKRQVEATGAAPLGSVSRAPVARAYEVRESCGNVRRSFLLWHPSNAGGRP